MIEKLGKILKKQIYSTYELLVVLWEKTDNVIDSVNGLINSLTEKISEKLIDMKTSGELASIIDEELLGGINAKIDNVINIKPSGLSDFTDWNNIQTAINEGKKVKLAEGVFFIKQPIQLKPNTVIQGSGYGLTRLYALNCILFQSYGESILAGNKHIVEVVISDLTLDGGDSAFHIVDAKASSHFIFDKVYFYSTLKSAINGVEFFDVRYDNCFFYWCGDEAGNNAVISLKNAANYEFCNNHFFNGCIFEGNRGKIIDIIGDNQSEYKFVNTKFENQYSYQVQLYFENIKNIFFYGVMVANTGATGSNYESMIKFKNCTGIIGDISLNKWDNGNSGRTSYSLPVSLVKIENCYEYDLKLALFHKVKISGGTYVDIINHATDGSRVKLFAVPNDTVTSVNPYLSDVSKNNVTIKHSGEPALVLQRNDKADYFQFGRLVTDGANTMCKFMHNEDELMRISGNNDIRFKTNIFYDYGFYLPQLPTASAPWGTNGAIYFDTTTNQLKCYIQGAWRVINRS